MESQLQNNMGACTHAHMHALERENECERNLGVLGEAEVFMHTYTHTYTPFVLEAIGKTGELGMELDS